jgi:hypothetical protein
VIECEYCHTKILMKNIAAQPMPAKKGNPAILIIGAAMLVGIVVIVVKVAGGSKSSGGESKPAVTPAAAAAATPPTPTPTKPPEPAKPPSIGKEVLKFGEEGTNAGQLSGARALAVVPSGEIVVAESRSGRAQVFDAKGAYQRVITLPPSALTKELSVFGAGATPDGKVVVSRAGDLLVLDVKAGTVEKTIRGSYPEVFYHGDVEVAQDGTIHAVIDRTGDLSVMHLSPAGKVLGKLNKAGATHVAVDGVGNMFLSKDDVVEVRDAKGEVQRKFSEAGTAKISSAAAIVTDGKAHVLVAQSNRVLVFTNEGGYLAELETPDIQDLAIDRAGALYVLSRASVTKYELTIPTK